MKNVFCSLLTIALGCCIANDLEAQARLVKDLVTTVSDAGSGPDMLVVLGEKFYFVADDGIHGRELWSSDGSEEGTSMVVDIYPGITSSVITSLIIFNDQLFFAAADPEHGRELWKSDGTAEGTTLVMDVEPGRFGSSPLKLTAMDTLLFFESFTLAYGREPWRSNGEADGTYLIKDVLPGPANSDISTPTKLNSTLYFGATTIEYGHELWKSDGTAEGTEFVFDSNPGPDGAELSSMIGIDGKLIFTSIVPVISNGFVQDQFEHGKIFITNGTENGTDVLLDLAPHGIGIHPTGFTLHAGEVYFAHLEAAVQDDTWEKKVLWKTNGTFAGTVPVEPDSTINTLDAQGLISFEGFLYFFSSDGTALQMCKTDGKPEGTIVVKTNSITEYYGGLATHLLAGKFVVSSPYRLWITDSSESSPMQSIADYHFAPLSMVALGSGIYMGLPGIFAGIPQGSVTELCVFSVTSMQLSLVKEINKGVQDGSRAGGLEIRNGLLNFIAINSYFSALYQTDGTNEGTSIVQPEGVSCYEIVGEVTYLGMGSSFYKKEGDGDPVLIKEVNTGSIFNIIPFGDFFHLHVGTYLGHASYITSWISDGTTDGTFLFEHAVFSQIVVGHLLYFADSQNRLYKTDGTIKGTTLIKEFSTEPGGGLISELVAIGDYIYFKGYSAATGVELWRSDGTESGTQVVKDINTSSSSYPSHLCRSGTDLYFIANDGVHGHELWKSDGTNDGTHMVKNISTHNDDLPNQTLSNSPFENVAMPLTAISNVIYFSATDGVHGFELWKSDGTEAGTYMVEDFSPGPANFSPHLMVGIKEKILFVANEGDDALGYGPGSGYYEYYNRLFLANPKIWEYDGQTAHVITGDYIWPENLIVLDTMLVFTANGVAGNELWAYGSYTYTGPGPEPDPDPDVTGVAKENLNELNAFPNPSSGLVNVGSFERDERANIRVFDSIGNSLRIEKPSFDDGRISVNLSSYPAGLYYIIINSAAKKSFKIIKR